MMRWQTGIAVLAAGAWAGLACGATPKSTAGKSFEQVPEVKLAADSGDTAAPRERSTTTERPFSTSKERPYSTSPERSHATPTERSRTTEVVEESSEDEMTEKQSFDSYSQLEDGQPGQPGEIELELNTGWQTQSGESDPWLLTPEIEWTPKCLPNTQFGVAVPLELLNGGVDGNGDLNVFWLQRWVQESPCHWWPTFSTLNELRVPSGYHSEGVDWTLTGILAKEVGPGTAYVNAFLRSANGENNIESGGNNGAFSDALFGTGDEGEDRRHFQWGFRFGYKWRITDCFAVITDYIHQSNDLYGHHNQNIGEVSAEWKVTDKLSIGPGVLFTLDGQEENVNFGAGVKIHYSFD